MVFCVDRANIGIHGFFFIVTFFSNQTKTGQGPIKFNVISISLEVQGDHNISWSESYGLKLRHRPSKRTFKGCI